MHKGPCIALFGIPLAVLHAWSADSPASFIAQGPQQYLNMPLVRLKRKPLRPPGHNPIQNTYLMDILGVRT